MRYGIHFIIIMSVLIYTLMYISESEYFQCYVQKYKHAFIYPKFEICITDRNIHINTKLL